MVSLLASPLDVHVQYGFVQATHACRFIGWVLRYKVTLESTFENRLAQSVSSFEVSGDDGFEFVDDGETTLNFCNDAALFGNRREWDRKCSQLRQIDRSQVRSLFPLAHKVLLRKRIPIPRHKLGLYIVHIETSTEDMILVNTIGDFTTPNPTSSEFVSIPTFVKKNIAR